MPASVPSRHVLVAGGGVGAIETVLALRQRAGDRIHVTLLAPDRHLTYRPLAVAAPFGAAHAVRYALTGIADALGVALVRDAVDAVDAGRRRVVTQDGLDVSYDALVLALGARARAAVPGALPFRGPHDLERTLAALHALDPGATHRVAFVAPPGVTWTGPLYELALLTGAWARREGLDLALTVVTPEPEPVAAFGPVASARVRALLRERGVALRTEAFAERVEDGRLQVTAAGSLAVDLVIALPSLAGPAVGGLPADGRGFVPVNDAGRVGGLEDVYAVGDMTQRAVKLGSLAIRQADAAASALAAWAGAPGGHPRGDEVPGRHLDPWLAAHRHLAGRGEDRARYARLP